MLSFYKDSNGRWYLNGRLTSPFQATMCIDSDNIVHIEPLNASIQEFEEPLSGIKKENGESYATYDELLSGVGDFFVEAPIDGADHEALTGLLGGDTNDHQHLTLTELELIDFLKNLDSGAILYFDKDSDTNPVLNDYRLRKSAQYLYIERHNGTEWSIVSTIGGSIETDSFKMKGELCSILNIQDGIPFNVWRITSNVNGNEFGSSRRDLYLTGSGDSKFYLSYNNGIPVSYNVETDNTSILSGALYQKEVTADKNYEIQTVTLNVNTECKLRFIVIDKLENRVIYKSLSDSDFATSGGILVKDYINNNTTGVINVLLVNVLYLVNGRTYIIKTEISEGSLKGSLSYPYNIANGYEFVKESIASRPWVINQNYVKTIATQIGDKTVANTTVETSMFNGLIGSYELPANFLTIGKTIKIRVVGVFSGLNSETPTIKIKLGNYTLISNTQALSKTFTNVIFDAEFVFTCRTAGINGTIIGQGHTTLYDGQAITTSTSRGLIMTSPSTVDTTIPLLIDMTYKWNTASASNSIRTTNIYIEALN